LAFVSLPRHSSVPISADAPFVAGDGKGPLYASLDAPVRVSPPDVAYPEGRLLVDRLGTGNLAPIIVVEGGVGRINPALAAHNIAVIKDTHGRTAQLSASDVESLSAYLRSLQK
jgi:hypothetical protein